MSERSIFLAALEVRDPVQRSAYLDSACGGDAVLRSQVAGLLASHEAAGSFLEPPTTAEAVTSKPHTEEPGTRLGPYKLLQQLGEGGMGTVWMAQQTEPVKRLVAVKLIKAGMDSRQVIARFEAERQALALMDHPNIARVLDGGTTSASRPYFVMDLVKGVPITWYCDEHHLTPRQRLELFVSVCQAVQHAHQKGIIHRDLKPSNVLVAPYDGKPIVKVIDFGVAKAAGQQLTDKTLVTEFGAVVGTLEYMSPEQAELNNQDIDTRSDIYSLGVLLYELLTGTPPLERERLKGAGLLEALRVIREQEPPTPSTRLGTTEQLPVIAANRGLEPKKLSGLVRGELDWIVMKALEKDRNRRYETANGFAADVQRYLKDEPVQACPPSTMYRFCKFVRRNRAGLVTAGLAGLALLVTTSAVGWTIRDRSAAALERAARQTKLDESIRAALRDVQAAYECDNLPEAITAFREAERLLGSDDLSRDELREQVRTWKEELDILQRLEDLNLSNIVGSKEDLRIDEAYASIFSGFGIDVDNLPVEEAGKRIRSRLTWCRLTEALDRWSMIRCEAEWFTNSRTKRGPGVAAFPRTQRLVQVARAADPDPLRSQVRLAIETRDHAMAKRLARSPEVLRLPPSLLPWLATFVYWAGGEMDRELASQMMEDARIRRPGDFHLTIGCASIQAWMGPQGFDKAVHYLELAWAIRPAYARVPLAIAVTQNKQKKYAAAVTYCRRAIALDPQVGEAYGSLGFALAAQGKFDEAIAVNHKAIELDPEKAEAHLNLGACLAHQKKLDEAISCFKTAIRLDPKLTHAYLNLGFCLRDQNKLDEAIVYFTQAMDLNPKYQMAYFELLTIFRRSGKRDQAVACFKKAIEVSPKNALAHTCLGDLLREQGKLAEAIACYTTAVGLDPKSSRAYHHLGVALAGEGKSAEAIGCFRQALALAPKYGAACAACSIHFDLASAVAGVHFDLGAALKHRGAADEAITCYRQGIEQRPEAWGQFARALLKQRRMPTDEDVFGPLLGIYQKLARTEPDSPRLMLELVQLLRSAGSVPETLALWEKLIDASSGKPDYRGRLGIKLWELADQSSAAGRHGEAEKALRCALDVFAKLVKDVPAEPWYRHEQGFAHWKLGWMLASHKRLQDAEASFRQALAIHEHLVKDDSSNLDYQLRLARSHEELAKILARLSKADDAAAEWDRCAAEFQKAIKLKPDAWEGWSGRAFVHFHRQQWKAAVADFSMAIDLAPQEHTNWRHRGHCYLNLAQWDKAALEFGKIVKRWPESGEDWYLLGVAHAGLQQPDQAMDNLRRALAKGDLVEERIKGDPRLDPLRSRGDYQRLLLAVKRKSKTEVKKTGR